MIMTHDKARKAATRQRRPETGEPYSVARHEVEREQAERGAGQAQRQADEAEEAADEAADLADETGDSPHTRRHRSYRDRDHDGADPGRSHQSRGPADRLQDRLGKLLGRFELLMSRAGQTTNPAHDEPKDTDSD